MLGPTGPRPEQGMRASLSETPDRAVVRTHFISQAIPPVSGAAERADSEYGSSPGRILLNKPLLDHAS